MNRIEAKWILMREVVRLRDQPYAQWLARLDRSEDMTRMGASGKVYLLEVTSVWDDQPHGDIRVLCSIDDGGWCKNCPIGYGVLVTKPTLSDKPRNRVEQQRMSSLSNQVPAESDWRSEPWGVDTPSAYKHFAGKSHGEAVALFRDNAPKYQEAVMFMPRACFVYYIHAYVDYLMSEASKDDSDGANCFFGLVEYRAEDVVVDATVVAAVIACLAHLAERQTWYDASPALYGNFAERARQAVAGLRAVGYGK
jgi:hypothetical protein